jgi:hypothetical protein
MADWTFPIDEQHNIYPNLTVHKRMRDGVQSGWRVLPNDGYVMYDTTDENWGVDPETGDLIPMIYYYTNVDLPVNFNFANFTWVAELRSNVPYPDNQIFGGGNNNEVTK